MIPKIIHYCAFGNIEKTELLERCRNSWAQFCPDYEIMEWNERTFENYQIPFYDAALAERSYAFASDYVRAFALWKFGGIYLDTDIELRNPLDPFLCHEAFTGFESPGFPFTAVWGSAQGHSLAHRIVEYYREASFTRVTNTQIVSDYLGKEFGVVRDRDEFQLAKDGLAIYPSTTFCIEAVNCVAVHHFAGSWLSNEEGTLPSWVIQNAAHHARRLSELNALTLPQTFSIIRSSVGIFPYLRWFLMRSIRHYARLLRNSLRAGRAT